jgi:hypothetical protein
MIFSDQLCLDEKIISSLIDKYTLACTRISKGCWKSGEALMQEYYKILSKMKITDYQFDSIVLNYVNKGWFKMKTECPVKVGEQIRVYGIDYAKAFVRSTYWREDEDRWQINLRWEYVDGNPVAGDGSIVYSTDYQKIFFKHLEVN